VVGGRRKGGNPKVALRLHLDGILAAVSLAAYLPILGSFTYSRIFCGWYFGGLVSGADFALDLTLLSFPPLLSSSLNLALTCSTSVFLGTLSTRCISSLVPTPLSLVYGIHHGCILMIFRDTSTGEGRRFWERVLIKSDATPFQILSRT